MMLQVFKVAKAMAPSIIYTDEVEKVSLLRLVCACLQSCCRSVPITTAHHHQNLDTGCQWELLHGYLYPQSSGSMPVSW